MEKEQIFRVEVVRRRKIGARKRLGKGQTREVAFPDQEQATALPLLAVATD
jgi:hypothetical protein